jgi:hypothetical protein
MILLNTRTQVVNDIGPKEYMMPSVQQEECRDLGNRRREEDLGIAITQNNIDCTIRATNPVVYAYEMHIVHRHT